MNSSPTDEAIRAYALNFRRSEGSIPLNSAAMAPLNTRAISSMMQMMSELSQPHAGRREQWALQYQAAHATFAKLLDCASQEVTFMPNVATALSHVAFALDLKADDEIVTVDQEYGSNILPWHAAASRSGAKIIKAQSGVDYSLESGAVTDLVGPKTRVVAVSWVQFQTGASLELHELSAACKRHGALLIVDGTQGVGISPFTMRGSGVSIVTGSLHKWLAGPPGLAYLAIRQDLIERFSPQVVGPYSFEELAFTFDAQARLHNSAARFQSGTPALIPIMGAAAAAESVLEAGVENLSEHSLGLAARLYKQLEEQGHRVVSPKIMTSPIVSFIPRQGLEAASQKLAARGISFALRGGAVRLAPHGFNTIYDIEQVFSALN